ncbi:hypothetical protein ACN28S_43625 [Cystobacter fuscus]
MKEAEEACRASIARGSKMNGPHFLALVLYLQGKDSEALQYVRTSLANTPRNPAAHFLHGLILRSLGKQSEAVEAWKAAADYRLTHTVVKERERTRAAWVRAIEEAKREQTVAELTLCGHYYLDLLLPDRSEACFARAESLRQGSTTAERLIHQAEVDPKAVLRATQSLPRKARNPDVLYAMAFAHERAGNPTEALRWLDESLRAAPAGHPGTRELLTRMCKELPLSDCLKQHRQGKQGP